MIIEAKNVSYHYKTKKDHKVLDDVSMSFEEGKFYTVIGPSGSGKTTFLSLLAGLDTPISGEILYGGEDILKRGLNHHRKHHVSLVFQNYNLIDYLTPKENVLLGGKKNPDTLLDEVGIPIEDRQRNVMQLSGGQQQRVAIARALASDAKVLLADEPTGNLDDQTAAGIRALLKHSAHELGKCVIVVTHSKQLAGEADEVIEIRGGIIHDMIFDRIIQDTTLSNLLTTKGCDFTDREIDDFISEKDMEINMESIKEKAMGKLNAIKR